MAYNKIVYVGTTLQDLTQDTIVPSHVLDGDTFHGADGEAGTGSMPNRGAVSGTIANKNDEYTIQRGFHDGTGKVGLSATQKNLLVSGNIKQGVTLMGVQGEYAGEPPVLQTKTKTYTPSTTAQSEDVIADSNYDALQKVSISVAAIPYREEPNEAGGITVTIG